ncbi:MAG: TonB-dependent receptor [Myxococcota bacterium]
MKTFITSLAALLILIGLGFTRDAHAQQSGSIVGNVEDINGAPVSGIRVRVTGSNLIGGAREVLTGADGSFRFVELPPGLYNLEASAKGFAPASQKGLKVGIGETVDLTFLMEVKTEEQTIKIRAKPLVDVNKVSLGTSLGKKFLEDVPSGRAYQDSATLLPGVVSEGNPVINGGSQYSNQYLVDGVNTTDPSTNTFAMNFNFDAIEELEVITGGFSPEYGNVSGGVINVVTKSGSNEFELDTSIYYRASGLSLEGLDQQPRNFDDLQFNVNLGGPIIKDHLWYFLSGEYDHSSSQLPRGSSVDALADVQHPSRLFESFYWLAKLTAAPDPKNRFTLLLQADPTIIDNSDQDPTESPEAETHQDQGGILVSLRYDGLFDPLVLKLQAAYKYSSLDIFPQRQAKSSSPFRMPGFFGAGSLSDKSSFSNTRGCLGKDQLADPATFDTDSAGRPTKCKDDIQDDPDFGDGLHYNADTGETSGSSGTDVFIERTRIQLTGSASYFLKDSLGDHEFRLGADLALMNDTDTTSNPGGASFFLDTDLDGDGVADPYYARITATDNNVLSTSADGLIFAVFLLDNWKIGDRLLIQPGLRFEQSTYENFSGKPILDFFTVSPRLWFAYDPWADGKTKIHGGYGHFYETGNLTLSKFIGRSLQTRLAFFDDTTGKYVENPNVIRLQGGESGTTVDPDIEPMAIDEFQIGIERAICEDLSVDVTYIHRHSANVWEDNETNLIWNQAGTDVIGSIDGTGQQVFNLTSDHHAHRDYDSLQIGLNRRLDDHWSFNGNYTLAFYKGQSPELLTRAFDNPRQNVYEEGYLPDDHRHTVKAQLTYAFDWGLTVGLSGVYETGGPYSKYFFNDYDGDYTNRRSPRGTDPGDDLNDPKDDRENRLPDLLTIDVRASWSLKPLTGIDIEVIAEVFNLLNASSVTAVETSSTEEGNYGQPTDRQRPFQAALGLRYRL